MIESEFMKLDKEWERDVDYQKEDIILDLTEQICELMERKGLNRNKLAKRLGTSRSYVTKLLRGNSNLTLETLIKIANALEDKIEIKFTSAHSYSTRDFDINQENTEEKIYKELDFTDILENLHYVNQINNFSKKSNKKIFTINTNVSPVKSCFETLQSCKMEEYNESPNAVEEIQPYTLAC